MENDCVNERTCDLRMEAMKCKGELCVKKIEARLDGMDEALGLRTRELERRLEGLNELRSEVIKDREQFLRQEVYNIKTSQYDAWVMQTNKRLTVMETRSIVWTAAIAIGFVVIQIILHYLNVVR